jgi:predicted KAP-like P-loop ATPase
MHASSTIKTMHRAASDEPIHSDLEDKLDRKNFAHALSGSIRAWSSSKCLVISLNSPWGMGKTSAKNLVLQALAKDSHPWSIVEFNPWQWSGYGQLSDAFFDEIAIALGKGSRKQNQELATTWRRYAAKLKGTSQVASALSAPLRFIMIFASLVCGIGAIWPNRIYLLVGGILIVSALLGEWTSGTLTAFANIKSPAAKDTERSLDDIRAELAKNLSRMDGNVLVVIDDLDRLSPKSLADIVQLVKANGDLPRMIYLLVGDRQVMAEHIASELHVDGQKYLEKIVQVSLDLPAIAIGRVQEILFAGLDEIITIDPVLKTFNIVRWQETFQRGLSIYFDNLRNVNRFLTTFEFHVRMLLSDSAFEVNAVDLIAIEAMRLFEPQLYSAIASAKSMLLNIDTFVVPSKGEAKSAYDRLLKSVPEARWESATKLLDVLFPALQCSLNGLNIGPGSKMEWSRDLRIASERHFDKYFRLFLDPKELSQSDIGDFLSAKEKSEFLSALTIFKERKILDKAVVRLREYEKEISVDYLAEAVSALFDIGDFVTAESTAMSSLTPSLSSEFFVRSLIERLPQEKSAADLLSQCLNKTTGLSLPANIVLTFDIKIKENAPFRDLTEEKLVPLKAKMVSKIEIAAKAGYLTSNPQARLLLHLWKDWGSLESVRAFVAELCQTREGAVAFLGSLICTMHSTRPNKQGGSARHYIRMADIEDFSSDKVIYEVILGGQLDPPFIQANHRILGLWRKAVARKEAGKADDGFHIADEDDE